MKNFKAKSSVLTAVIALFVVTTLSLVAFAAKGPCVGGGSGPYGPIETVSVDGGTKTVESGTMHYDQVCAGLNENDCTETNVDVATRKEGTLETYTKVEDPFSGYFFWGLVSTENVLTKGKRVC